MKRIFMSPLCYGAIFFIIATFIFWGKKMSIGLLVVGIVLVLFIGNFMGAKPKDFEVRTDTVRMTAIRLQLSPKLVVLPDFLVQKSNENQAKKVHYDYRKDQATMISQYTLVNDNWQLPKAEFILDNGVFVLLKKEHSDNAKTYLERQTQKLADNAKVLDKDKLPEHLTSFLPFLKGVVIQANSISLFWYDDKWASQMNKETKSNNANEFNALIENELTALKQAMGEWAERVATAPR